jgi:hypothetical protein
MTQLVPTWFVNATSAFMPAACYDPRQALGFDITALQRTFWDALSHTSPRSVQGRTIHQDPDELGYWVEND